MRASSIRLLAVFALAALAGRARAGETRASMDAREATVRRVAAEATTKTVAVRIQTGELVRGFGSGAVVSPEGHVLTCAHVVEAAEPGGTLVAIFPDRTERPLAVLAKNSRNDLALCRMGAGADEEGPPEGLPHFDVAPGDLAVGEWVVALGHPGGPFDDRRPTVSVGKVIEPKRRLSIVYPDRKDYEPGVQSDAPLFGGNSGGPLVDLEGRLVGINGAILYVGDAAFSVPASRIRAELPAMREGRDVEGDSIAIFELIAAMLQLSQEVDPRDMLEAYADSGLGLFLKALSSLSAASAPRPVLKGRRLDDFRAAYAPLPGPARTGALRVGGRPAGFACLWEAREGRARWLTSARLVPKGSTVAVVAPGEEAERPARALGRDGEWDVALLETDAPADRTVPPPAIASDVTPGSWALLAGPDGALYQAGAVAAVDRGVGKDRRFSAFGIMGLFRPPHTAPYRPWKQVVQVDVPLRAEQFGGPVQRPDGSLVGLAVGHLYRAVSFVTPASGFAPRLAALAGGADVAAPPEYDPGLVPRPTVREVEAEAGR